MRIFFLENRENLGKFENCENVEILEISGSCKNLIENNEKI